MDKDEQLQEVDTVTEVSEPEETPKTVQAPEPSQSQPPVENRFLFVDIASQRAKQLRRGALPKTNSIQENLEALTRSDAVGNKMERIAMEEVRQGLIAYELPQGPHKQTEGAE